jgi:hypothetical protein
VFVSKVDCFHRNIDTFDKHCVCQFNLPLAHCYRPDIFAWVEALLLARSAAYNEEKADVLV